MIADYVVRVRQEGHLTWHWRKDVQGPCETVIVLEGFALTNRGARRAGKRARLTAPR